MMIPNPTRFTKIVRKMMMRGRGTTVRTFYTITAEPWRSQRVKAHEIADFRLQISDWSGVHRPRSRRLFVRFRRPRADAGAETDASRDASAGNPRDPRHRGRRPALLRLRGSSHPATGGQRCGRR